MPPQSLLEDCFKEIAFLIDERREPLTNRKLLEICRPLGEICAGGFDPHFPHEIVEGAVNLLIGAKYSVELLTATNPGHEYTETLKSLVERMPTESWRSREQTIRQQFSTPPAIAYILAFLLNLKTANEFSKLPPELAV